MINLLHTPCVTLRNFQLCVLQLHVEANNVAALTRETPLYSCLVDLESCQKQVEMDKKAIDELIRERDNINKVDLMEARDQK